MSEGFTEAAGIANLFLRALVIWGLFGIGLTVLAFMALSAASESHAQDAQDVTKRRKT
jgi:hypothetical protein